MTPAEQVNTEEQVKENPQETGEETAEKVDPEVYFGEETPATDSTEALSEMDIKIQELLDKSDSLTLMNQIISWEIPLEDFQKFYHDKIMSTVPDGQKDIIESQRLATRNDDLKKYVDKMKTATPQQKMMSTPAFKNNFYADIKAAEQWIITRSISGNAVTKKFNWIVKL